MIYSRKGRCTAILLYSVINVMKIDINLVDVNRIFAL